MTFKRKELPELNDEFAKEASSYETIEELKKIFALKWKKKLPVAQSILTMQT